MHDFYEQLCGCHRARSQEPDFQYVNTSPSLDSLSSQLFSNLSTAGLSYCICQASPGRLPGLYYQAGRRCSAGKLDFYKQFSDIQEHLWAGKRPFTHYSLHAHFDIFLMVSVPICISVIMYQTEGFQPVVPVLPRNF